MSEPEPRALTTRTVVSLTIKDVDPEFSALVASGRAGVPEEVFWADYIAGLKNDPARRLQVALAYLPLPAAFRHAATAVRAMIRERRTNKQGEAEYLATLYRLASVHDLLFHTPYITELQVPAFEVARHIPVAAAWTAAYPYAEIGYAELELLSATDRKWIAAAWGEATRHRSAQSFHAPMWNDALRQARAARAEEDRRRAGEWIELVRDAQSNHGPTQ